MYLSEHGLEEVRVPKPLGDLSTEEKGSVIVAQHMQTVRLCQRNVCVCVCVCVHVCVLYVGH